MPSGFEATAEITCSPEEVWARLTDWASAPAWMHGIDRLTPEGDGPMGAGTRLAFRARGAERRSTIVTGSPPACLALRSVQGGVTATYTYVCAPTPNGTRLTLWATCEASGLAWRFTAPLIGYLMRRTDAGQVAALKRLCENGRMRRDADGDGMGGQPARIVSNQPVSAGSYRSPRRESISRLPGSWG